MRLFLVGLLGFFVGANLARCQTTVGGTNSGIGVTISGGSGGGGGGITSINTDTTAAQVIAGTTNQLTVTSSGGTTTLAFPTAGVTLPGVTTLAAGTISAPSLQWPHTGSGKLGFYALDNQNIGLPDFNLTLINSGDIRFFARLGYNNFDITESLHSTFDMTFYNTAGVGSANVVGVLSDSALLFGPFTGGALNTGIVRDDSDGILKIANASIVLQPLYAASVSTGVGSGVAGKLDLSSGTLPASFPVNSFSLYAPASIASSYRWRLPAADAAGVIVSDGGATPGILSIVPTTGTGNIIRASAAGGAPGSPNLSLQANCSGAFCGSGASWTGTDVYQTFGFFGGGLNDLSVSGSYTGIGTNVNAVFQPIIATTPSPVTITAGTNASPTQLTAVGHGLTTGNVVVISGAGTNWAAINGTFTATVTGVDTFTIPVDSTTFGALDGSPVVAPPDTFQWQKCLAGTCGALSAEIAINGSAQLLADGVSVTFAATTGHSSGDLWNIVTGAMGLPNVLELQPNVVGDTLDGPNLTIKAPDGGLAVVSFEGDGGSAWIQATSGNNTPVWMFSTSGGTLKTPLPSADNAGVGVIYWSYRNPANNVATLAYDRAFVTSVASGAGYRQFNVGGGDFRMDTTGKFSANGSIQAPLIDTTTNCSSSASPAVCGAAPAGSVAIPTGVTSVALTVNTTAVTANSQILVFPDDTLGTKLSVTCNSTLATLVGGMAITARTPGTSFEVTYNGTIATNPLCVSYMIVN